MYKNILVINLMQIGDLMLVTPILRALRIEFPQARLTLLADKRWADLVQYNERLDECLLLDKKGLDKGLRKFVDFVLKLRRKRYDLVVNLHRNERASALAAFSGGEKIIGYAKPFFALFFDQVMPNLKAVKHQIHSHFDVLREGHVIECADDGGLEMNLPPDADKRADIIWRDNFSEHDKVVALNIGASWITKRWLPEYFASCADSFIDEGYAVVFLGGNMDEDLVRLCVGYMKYRSAVSFEDNSTCSRLKILTGKLSLGELAAVLKRCVLLVTTDSGPMHIGVAMNVPIVTMFGASPVPGFYPYDAKDILIKTPEPCHPCGKHECPRSGDENLACMKKMSVNTIMKYAHELLDETQGRPAYELPPHYGNYECRVIDLAEG